MSQPVLARTQKEAALDALVAGDLMGAKVMLFVNDVALSEDTVTADLTAPTFTGYALSSAVTWSAAYEEDGQMVTAGGSKTFVCSAGPADDIIKGWAVVTGMGSDFLFGQILDNPVPIADTGDGITVLPILPYGA